MSLAPTEIGARLWSLHYIAREKPESPYLCLLVETAESATSVSLLPSKYNFHMSALAKAGPHMESEKIWEMEALALCPLACYKGREVE